MENTAKVFSGRDIAVTADIFDDRRELLVVSFPSAQGNPTLEKPGFAEKWLKGLGISNVSVKVSSNHWFQTPETDEALAAISEIAKGFDRVATYGSSMGAYAAIACSRALSADAVISVSPQWTIDPGKIPWDGRWITHSNKILATHGFMRDNIAELATQNGEIFIVADPWDIDARHARELVTAIPWARWIQLPGGSHPALSLLKDYKLVSKFALSLIRTGYDAAQWRPEFRARRLTAARYWLALAQRSAKRGSHGFKTTIAAAHRAVELDNGRDRFLRLAGQALLTAGSPEGAAEVLSRAAHLPDFNPITMAILAQSLFKSGRAEEACRLVEQLLEIDPENKRIKGLLASKASFINSKYL